MFLYYLLMLFCYFLGGALGRLCRLFYCFSLNSTAFFDLLSISRSSREKIRENTKQSKSTRKQSNLIHKDLPRKSRTEHDTYQGYTQKVLGGTRGGWVLGAGDTQVGRRHRALYRPLALWDTQLHTQYLLTLPHIFSCSYFL